MSTSFTNVGFNVPTNADFNSSAVQKNNSKVSAPAAEKINNVPEADSFTPSDNAKVDNDKVEAQAVKSSEKKPKKGLIRCFKDFVGTTKKFFASASEYIKGGVKGLAGGAVAGLSTIGVLTLANKGKHAKLFGALVGLAGLGVGLFSASLRANERRSEIDHTWGNTPITKQH